jgi:opacity protein-like surface antigen
MPDRLTVASWAALACLLSLPATAAAQDDRGAVVSGFAAASVIESNTDVAFGGTFGYRFSRVFGLEIEATVVPSLHGGLEDDFPVIQALTWSSSIGSPITQIFPGPTISDTGGRMVIFTNNARVEIPTLSDRVLPYFVAGGGIASTRRTAQIEYFTPAITNPSNPLLPTAPLLRPTPAPIVSAATDLALTNGGGVGIRVARRMAIDVDLRLFRLLGSEDVNVGRFGVGARYRF